MPRKREPVTITELGRYECAQCHVRFAWASTRPIDPPEQRKGIGGRRGGGKPPKYCSNFCAAKTRRAKQHTYNVECLYCMTPFRCRHKEQQYCSRQCGAKAKSGNGICTQLPAEHWARWYGRFSEWAPKIPRPSLVAGFCRLCKTPYVDTWLGTASATFCSKRCREKSGKAIYRARRRGAGLAQPGITWQSVANRDGMMCYLCDEPCDPNDIEGMIAGKRYPSVDHVFPVSRGGAHSWTNVRLAHRRCNGVKRDKTPTLQ